MSNAGENRALFAGLSAHKPGKLNMKELADLFHDDTGSKAVRKYTHRSRAPLWEGFFGMFEGPLVLPYKSTDIRFFGAGVSAETHAEGIIGNRRPSSELSAYGNAGANLTAASAYAYKQGMDAGVSVSLDYLGVLPPIPTDRTGNAKIRVHDRPGMDASEGDIESLVFNGVVYANSVKTLDHLPSIVESQAELMSEFDGTDRTGEVLGLYGAQSFVQLGEAWNEALGQPSAKAAALAIQGMLN